MTPEELVGSIEKYRLRVSPVFEFSNSKKTALRLLYWTAGHVSVGSEGWTNLVENRHFAKGLTLEAAVVRAVEMFEESGEPLMPIKSRKRT